MIQFLNIVFLVLLFSCSTDSEQGVQGNELSNEAYSQNQQGNSQNAPYDSNSAEEEDDEEYGGNETAESESGNNSEDEVANQYEEQGNSEESNEYEQAANETDENSYDSNETDSETNYEQNSADNVYDSSNSENLNSAEEAFESNEVLDTDNSQNEMRNAEQLTNNNYSSDTSLVDNYNTSTQSAAEVEETTMAQETADSVLVAEPTTEQVAENTEQANSEEFAEEEFTEGEDYTLDPILDELVWIGHKIDYKNRKVQIKILTKGEPVFEVFQEQNRSEQPELVIRFFETDLRRKIKWDINASEFHSPVAYIRPRVDNYNAVVDVVITVRDEVKPLFLSEKSNITLTFDIPKRYDGEAGKSTGEKATEEGSAVTLSGINLTPQFEENSELPPSLAYLAEGNSADTEGEQVSEPVNEGVGIDEVMSPEGSFDSEGLPANFNEESEESDENLLMQLESIEDIYILSVAQDAIYDDEASEEFPADNTTGDGFSNIANDSYGNLDSGSEAYETADAPEQVGDLDPGVASAQQYDGNVLSIEFVDSKLGLVLQTLQEETGNNFIIPDELRRTNITVSFKNVPWDEALKAILEAYQLGMVRVGESIVRIDKIENLSAYITELDKIKEMEIKREPTKILVMRLNSSKASVIQPKLSAILAKDIKLDDRIISSFDDRTNSVIVEAPERILAKIKNILQRLDLETPQVEIASRIVSIQKNDNNTFGVAWTGAFNYDPGRGLSFGALNFPNSLASSFSVDPGVSNLQTAGATRLKFGSINNFLDLDMFLKMEERRGTANVLQSNKIIVLDGEKAKILQGSTQYFRVPAPVGGTTVQQMSAVEFNLELEVTPRISADGNVQMELAITSDSPADTTGDQAANKNSKISRNKDDEKEWRDRCYRWHLRHYENYC